MSHALEVVFKCECSSTHHKLAIDALRHLKGSHAEAWRNLFLRCFDDYLIGSKAPDKKFKDFRNHVLHVDDNYWGGAVDAAKSWFDQAVDHLQNRRWSQGVYAAGVLSHYYTDPIQPLHTAQSEEEGSIHRALEWSVTRSFDVLRQMLLDDLGGYPQVATPSSTVDWVEEMVVAGAEEAHPHYNLLIDHYDLNVGVKDPPAGLDATAQQCLARLIGYASVGWARMLERLFDAASVPPPGGSAGLVGYLARLTTPISWIVRKLSHQKDRAAVRRIHAEVQKTGRAIASLPEDDRTVRGLHAEEVLKISLEELAKTEVRPAGQKYVAPPNRSPARRKSGSTGKKVENQRGSAQAGLQSGKGEGNADATDAASGGVVTRPARLGARSSDGDNRGDSGQRFYLSPGDAIVDAPSIGGKTARRLEAVGIRTVEDLLAADPEEVGRRTRRSYMDGPTVARWQAEATLVCRVPNLRGHDAQILVGCELTEPEEIALMDADELLDLALSFVATPAGKRVLRDMASPDLNEVRDWIEWSGEARGLATARRQAG